jgi:large-conductance mechanosensitive channel
MSGNIGAEEASSEHRHKLNWRSDLDTSKVLAEAKQRSKKAARAAFWQLVCAPFKCLCCVCTSFGGVLMLMRSENTREFALAVVIGNVFERYCNNVADYVVGPLVRWFVPPFNEWTWNSMAFIRGMEALQLSGGQLYSNPADARVVAARAGSMESAYKDEMVNGINDPIAAAQADGAIIIQIQNIIDSSIGFVITLLNIYWFFNCIATTERLEKAVKGAYSKGKEVAEKAAREAAKTAQLDALKGMTQQERDDMDNAFANYDTECTSAATDPTRPILRLAPQPCSPAHACLPSLCGHSQAPPLGCGTRRERPTFARARASRR